MILHINTTKGDEIEVVLRSGDKAVARKKVSARFAQAEKLLPLVNKILRDNKLGLKDVEGIMVNNEGGSPASGRGISFTALRIGVVTANALGYAIGCRTSDVGFRRSDFGFRMSDVGCRKRGFDVVAPIYDKEPNITVKNK